MKGDGKVEIDEDTLEFLQKMMPLAEAANEFEEQKLKGKMLH